MTQIDILKWFVSFQNPFLDRFAGIFTFLGNQEFYFLMIPLIFWGFSKTAGFRLLYILLISMYVNTWIKISTGLPRPVGMEGISSKFVESAAEGSHYPFDSFPSGHAQGSTTLWGYLAYRVAKPWFWLIPISLIFCISATRLYAGLHWPIDVVGGIMMGIIILLVAVRVEEKIAQLSRKVHWLLVIAVPLTMAVLFSEPEGLKYSGFLLGAGVAYLLEGQYVRMDVHTQIWKKIVAFILGMSGMVLLQVGLKPILADVMISDVIRYALIGVWGLLGAPWVFVKLGLYPRENDTPIHPRPPLSV